MEPSMFRQLIADMQSALNKKSADSMDALYIGELLILAKTQCTPKQLHEFLNVILF